MSQGPSGDTSIGIRLYIQVSEEGTTQIRNLTEALELLKREGYEAKNALSGATQAVQSMGKGFESAFRSNAAGMAEFARQYETLNKMEDALDGVAKRSPTVRSALNMMREATTDTTEGFEQIYKAMNLYAEKGKGATSAEIKAVREGELAWEKIQRAIGNTSTTLGDMQTVFSRMSAGIGIAPQELVKTFNDLGVSAIYLAQNLRSDPAAFERVQVNLKLTTDEAKAFGIPLEKLSEILPTFAIGLTRTIQPGETFKALLGEIANLSSLSSEKQLLLTKSLSGVGVDIQSLVPLAKGLSGTFTQSDQSVEAMIPTLQKLGMFAQNTGIPIQDLFRYVEASPQGFARAEAGMNTFTQAAEKMRWSVAQAAVQYPGVAEELLKFGIAGKRASAMMQTGFQELESGTMLLSRQLFWVGLGTMFLNMSLARSVRTAQAVKSEALSLVRSYMAVGDAQKRLSDIVSEYGANSEEAVDANRQFKLAQIEVEFATERARASIEQAGMATTMFWVSAAAQTIGTGAMMVRALDQILWGYNMISFSRGMNAAEMTQEAAAQTALTGSIVSEGVAQQWNNQQKMQGVVTSPLLTAVLRALGIQASLTAGQAVALGLALNFAIGVATMGIATLIGIGITSVTTAKMMADLEEQTKKLKKELGIETGGTGIEELGSHMETTTQSIYAATDAMQEFNVIASRGIPPSVAGGVTVGGGVVENFSKEIYKETKEIRQGFNISSPGASVELKGFNEFTRLMKKRSAEGEGDKYTEYTWMALEEIKEGWGIHSPGINVPIFNEIANALYSVYEGILGIKPLNVQSQLKEKIMETIRDSKTSSYRDIQREIERDVKEFDSKTFDSATFDSKSYSYLKSSDILRDFVTSRDKVKETYERSLSKERIEEQLAEYRVPELKTAPISVAIGEATPPTVIVETPEVEVVTEMPEERNIVPGVGVLAGGLGLSALAGLKLAPAGITVGLGEAVTGGAAPAYLQPMYPLIPELGVGGTAPAISLPVGAAAGYAVAGVVPPLVTAWFLREYGPDIFGVRETWNKLVVEGQKIPEEMRPQAPKLLGGFDLGRLLGSLGGLGRGILPTMFNIRMNPLERLVSQGIQFPRISLPEIKLPQIITATGVAKRVPTTPREWQIYLKQLGTTENVYSTNIGGTGVENIYSMQEAGKREREENIVMTTERGEGIENIFRMPKEETRVENLIRIPSGETGIENIIRLPTMEEGEENIIRIPATVAGVQNIIRMPLVRMPIGRGRENIINVPETKEAEVENYIKLSMVEAGVENIIRTPEVGGLRESIVNIQPIENIVRIPEIEMPGTKPLSMPRLEIPEVVANVSPPDVEVPEVSNILRIPDIQVPKIGVPPVELPSIQNMINPPSVEVQPVKVSLSPRFEGREQEAPSVNIELGREEKERAVVQRLGRERIKQELPPISNILSVPQDLLSELRLPNIYNEPQIDIPEARNIIRVPEISIPEIELPYLTSQKGDTFVRQVNIDNPVLKSEKDIRKLRKQIDESFMIGVYSRGR